MKISSTVRNTLPTIALLFFVSGCGQDSEITAKQNADKEWTEQNQAAAPNVLSKSELATCANDYKANMNDPSSFSLVSTKAEKVEGIGVDSAVMYGAKIRGKNKFGGVVLHNMFCTFRYDAAKKKLTFVKAWD